MKEANSGKRFKCPICEREFNNKKSMTNHRRWHNLPEYKGFQEKYKKRMQGNNNPIYGKKRSAETKKKISESNKRFDKSKERNPNYRGNNAKKSAIHMWMNKYKPKPEKCETCGKKTDKLHCSNKDHKYSRNPDDYRWLCQSCHYKYDVKKGYRKNPGIHLREIRGGGH